MTIAESVPESALYAYVENVVVSIVPDVFVVLSTSCPPDNEVPPELSVNPAANLGDVPVSPVKLIDFELSPAGADILGSYTLSVEVTSSGITAGFAVL